MEMDMEGKLIFGSCLIICLKVRIVRNAVAIVDICVGLHVLMESSKNSVVFLLANIFMCW